MNNKNCEKFEREMEDLLSELKNSDSNSLKKINFLFGAGFNFNISDDAMSWDKLSLNALKTKVQSENRSVFETKLITEGIIKKLDNNKLILSITDNEQFKMDSMTLNNSKIRFEIETSLKQIKRKFPTMFYTLNYDTLLETMLDMFPYNSLAFETIEKDKVNHLHGLADRGGTISNKRLLTLEDYVFNQQKVSKLLQNFLFLPKEKNKITEHLFIFGSSLQEEHILQALNIKDEEELNKKFTKIIWFTSLPNDDYIISPIKKVYKKLNVQILNYNIFEDEDQSYNFRFAWNRFTDFLLDDSKIFSSYSNIDSIDPLLVTKWEEPKINQFLQSGLFAKAPNKKMSDIINELFRCQKIDHNQYLEFLTRHLEVIKLGDIRFIESDFDGKILGNYFEKVRSGFSRVKSNPEQYVKDFFKLVSTIKKDSILETEEFAKLAAQYIILDLRGELHFKSNKNAYSNKFIDIDWILTNTFHIRKMPKVTNYNNFIHLVESKIDGSIKLNQFKNPNLNSLEKLLDDEYLVFGVNYLILLTKRWNNYIQNNFKEIEKHYYTLEGRMKHRWFTLMYVSFLGSDEYFNFAREQTDFLKFPNSMNIIGSRGSFVETFAEQDDKFINAIPGFESLKEATEFMNSNDIKILENHQKFIQRMKGIKVPKKDKIAFAKGILDLWFKLEYEFLFWKDDDVSINMNLETVEDIYEVGKYILNKGGLFAKLPISYRNHEKEQEFIENQLINIESISEKDYLKLLFFKTHGIHYSGGYHIADKWFKAGVNSESKKIQTEIIEELKKYIKEDQDLINSIMTGEFLKIKNRDYLFFYHVYDKNKKELSEKDFINALTIKGNLIEDEALAPILKNFIYNSRIYEDINDFYHFIKNIKKIKKIDSLQTLAIKIKIYTLCKHKEPSDFTNNDSDIFNESIANVLDVMKNYYKELNEEVLINFLVNASQNEKNSFAFSPYSWLSKLDLSEKIKIVLGKKIDEIFNMFEEEGVFIYLKNIIKFIDGQSIPISDKLKTKIKEYKADL